MNKSVLKQLREESGYSQESLAKKLGISRQTLLKYESGGIPCVEIIKKTAQIFEVPYECLIDNKMPVRVGYNVVPAGEKIVPAEEIRIDIPQENIEKFKQVFLYILAKVGAKPNVGQTVLYKLLYFIDFDFYEIYEEQLMGLKYIKNTYGPTPVDFAKITREMEESGEIEIVKTKYFDKDQTKYLPVKTPNLKLFTGTELEHLNRELERFSGMTAKEISDFSHKDVPWIGANDKEIIDYEAVFYRNPETSARGYE